MCFQKKQALLWRMTAKLAKIKQFDRRRNFPAGAQKVNKCEVARYSEAPQPPVTHSSHWTGTTSSFNTRSRHLDLGGLFPLRAIQQAGIVCWDVTLRESEGSRKKVFMPRKFLVAFPMRNVCGSGQFYKVHVIVGNYRDPSAPITPPAEVSITYPVRNTPH
ncbi:hypothetical protein DFH06DRAFT_1122685 [Mycena polygramma]|nr:hypothetical protein DFH06DRAFT_1122685 [Mycena polygramma]